MIPSASLCVTLTLQLDNPKCRGDPILSVTQAVAHLRTLMMPTNDFDLQRARAETRGCEEVIHFNNAGAGLMPIPVSDTLHAYLHQEERIGGYETERAQAAALTNFYTAAARLLNAHPDEIAFIENATRAWDMAFYSFKFAPGDRILTTYSEYGSNIVAYLQQAQRYDAEVIFVPSDATGQIDVAALADLIDDRVKLISISHIPTGGGVSQSGRGSRQDCTRGGDSISS